MAKYNPGYGSTCEGEDWITDNSIPGVQVATAHFYFNEVWGPQQLGGRKVGGEGGLVGWVGGWVGRSVVHGGKVCSRWEGGWSNHPTVGRCVGGWVVSPVLPVLVVHGG